MNLDDTLRSKHAAPGFHYLLFSHDSMLVDHVEGYANVEDRIPMTAETSFNAFSTTKLFTAVAVMQLVGSGRLDLTDPIAKYLPQFAFPKEVTIARLLSHQSGIRNPMPIKWVHEPGQHEHFPFEEFADSIIQRATKLKAKPGSTFSYSNVNYLLLGRLLETLLGTTYQSAIKDSILDRISSGYFMGFEIPEQDYATGYHRNNWVQRQLLSYMLNPSSKIYAADADWLGFEHFYLNGPSYGGLITSPYGLMEFCRAFIGSQNPLLEEQQVRQMFEPQTLSGGAVSEMALAWYRGTAGGHSYYCHAGGGGGYYCELRIYPKLGLGSVLMTNGTGIRDKRALDRLDKAFLSPSSNLKFVI